MLWLLQHVMEPRRLRAESVQALGVGQPSKRDTQSFEPGCRMCHSMSSTSHTHTTLQGRCMVLPDAARTNQGTHLFCTKLERSPVLLLPPASSLRCPPVRSCSMLDRSPLLLLLPPAAPAPVLA